MLYSVLAALCLQATLGNAVPLEASKPNSTKCKPIPGDTKWPDTQSWAKLNQTVGGKLIATVPLGSVCHGSSYDEAKCNALKAPWGTGPLAVPQPAEFMSSWFQNNTCTPFSDKSTPCTLGNYASYSIDVRSAQDVQAGLEFARSRNIRLVVKNSGHDFFGKSTGKGALSLWVHNLNSKQFIEKYNASYYKGPAIRIGAGVEGSEASKFASEHGHRVVTGSCPTVKAAGGYTQGGGHSFLSGLYGFGADNVLEWEAVTAAGEHVVATPTNEHADLYWALSGGGGGTFAVVVSMTVRAFPDGNVSLGSLVVSVANTGSVDAYWEGVEVFHKQLQPLVDQGIVAEYIITNDTLNVVAIIAPDQTADSFRSALNPMVSALGTVGGGNKLDATSMALSVIQKSTYYEMLASNIAPVLENLTIAPAVGGRFIPRSVNENDSRKWHDAMREAIGNGRHTIVAATLNATNPHRKPAVAPNSVQPNFVSAFSSLIINTMWSNTQPWSDAPGALKELDTEVMPPLEKATPGAGAYKNEASWSEKDWQQSFYGNTYPRLSTIKQKYDPTGVFYGLTAVGSEKWFSDSEGRLCRA